MTRPVRLRVVTFNIHGGRPRRGRVDLEATAAVIRDLAPDLVGLQEVHRYPPGCSPFQDQPRRLSRLLGMEVTFRPSFGLGGFGYGNAILSSRRPDRVRRVRLPGAGEPRSALEAVLTLGRISLRLLNTHFGLCQADRVQQGRALGALAREGCEPVLLTGDLNAPPDAPEVAAVRDAGLGPCAPGPVLTYPDDDPRHAIDHILVSARFEVVRCYAVPTAASDHLPVVADLILR